MYVLSQLTIMGYYRTRVYYAVVTYNSVILNDCPGVDLNTAAKFGRWRYIGKRVNEVDRVIAAPTTLITTLVFFWGRLKNQTRS